MAKKVVKTTDQVINTISLQLKKVANDARKDPNVCFITFYGKKSEQHGRMYADASVQNVFGTIMQLMTYCGCNKEECEAVAKEVQNGLRRKYPPMEVVKEEVTSDTPQAEAPGTDTPPIATPDTP